MDGVSRYAQFEVSVYHRFGKMCLCVIELHEARHATDERSVGGLVASDCSTHERHDAFSVRVALDPVSLGDHAAEDHSCVAVE